MSNDPARRLKHGAHRVLWLVLLAFAPVSAPVLSAQSPAVVSNAQPQDALIVLQMGACERRCPVYKLIIFADATTVYEGRHYVTKPGVARGKMSLDVLGKVLAEADSMRFYGLKQQYAPAPSVTEKAMSGECLTPKSDAPTAILTVSAGGRSNTIVHFRGCGGADAERLTQFEDRILSAANIAKFIR